VFSFTLGTTTFRRLTVGVAAGTLLLLGPAPVEAAAAAPPGVPPAGGAAPARAGLTCGSSTNPTTLSHLETVTSTRVGRATVSLRDGRRGGRIYLWALITGASARDTVRLDWADAGLGGRRHRCSATVHRGSDQHTVAVAYAQSGGSHRQFRACGHRGGVTKCTRWVP